MAVSYVGGFDLLFLEYSYICVLNMRVDLDHVDISRSGWADWRSIFLVAVGAHATKALQSHYGLFKIF